VEIVQAAFLAFDKGDIDGVQRFFDENVEITQADEFVGASRQQYGHAGVLEALAIWPEQWDDYRIEILRLDDMGDRVLAVTSNRGRGKQSGVEVESPFTFLFTLRAGKITEWRFFMHERQALNAAGLEG
jgi:ketosteroid isomerase-like protein